jgi:predicted RNA-binding Zn ribbon-like protein
METIMPTKATPPTTPMGVDPAAYEDAAKRIRDLTERLIESSKAAGLTSLDAYEKALKSLVDFEHKVAGASQLDWVSALATTHATFVQDVSAAYTKAARDLLS